MGKASNRKSANKNIENQPQASPEKKNSAGKLIKEALSIILYALILAAVIKGLIVDSRAIPSASMEPTIMTNDRVIMSRLSYLGKSEPERGDIIVFTAPAELDQSSDLIKRVIGLPGDTVEVKDGAVYINDERLDEDYLAEPPDYTYEKVVVPEDCYFVMGDNRNDSIDSHRWFNPFLSESSIKGKAVCIYWPLDRIGAL